MTNDKYSGSLRRLREVGDLSRASDSYEAVVEQYHARPDKPRNRFYPKGKDEVLMPLSDARLYLELVLANPEVLDAAVHARLWQEEYDRTLPLGPPGEQPDFPRKALAILGAFETWFRVTYQNDILYRPSHGRISSIAARIRLGRIDHNDSAAVDRALLDTGSFRDDREE
jgi:hypothetical protein